MLKEKVIEERPLTGCLFRELLMCSEFSFGVDEMF